MHDLWERQRLGSEIAKLRAESADGPAYAADGDEVRLSAPSDEMLPRV